MKSKQHKLPARHLRTDGFTLVETAISLVASAIVLIGIAVLLSISQKQLTSARAEVRLQQDMSLLGQTLANRVRGSVQSKQKVYADYASYRKDEASRPTGSCLKLYDLNNSSVLIYQDSSDLKIVNKDASTTNLLQGIVSTLTFVDSAKSIHTNVTLAKEQWSITAAFTDAFRNFSPTTAKTNNWPYAIFSNDKIDFSSGTGTITGKVHGNSKVKLGSHVLDGAITAGPPDITPPAIDWKFFSDLAKQEGQRVRTKTFKAGKSYSGVWYCSKRATIESNVTINGTLIVRGACKIRGDRIVIKATSPSYPALVARKELKISYNDIQITGFVSCTEELELEGDNLTLTGAMISTAEDIESEGTNTSITFDSAYIHYLQGVDFN